jgi:CubicO group peptidase (beta-lactamase class C family)
MFVNFFMKERLVQKIFLALVGIGSTSTFAQIDLRLDTVMTSYDLMGMSVVGICNKNIVYSKGFGKANFATGDRITDSTLYRIASLSKTVTAAAAMKLYEQGIVQLDADVNNYLGFSLRNPNFPNSPITLRMLLSHTSGIQDGTGYDNFLTATANINPPPSISQLLVPGGTYYTSNMFLNKAPGSNYQYSNVEFGIIATIVEKMANKRFDIYCRENIFQPLGMTASFRVNDLPNINNLAVLYRKSGGAWVPQFDNYNGTMPAPRDLSAYTLGTNGFIFSPQGGLRVSANDLARFLLMLMNQGIYNNNRVLNDTTVKRMYQAAWTYNGSNGSTSGGIFRSYGLGVHITTNAAGQDIVIPNKIMYGHPGEAYGLISDMYFDSSRNIGLIFITNGSGTGYPLGQNTAYYAQEQKVFDILNAEIFVSCFATGMLNPAGVVASLQVFPNPATTQWQLRLPANAGRTQIQIYNAAGQVVFTQQQNRSGGLVQIPAGNFAPGRYWLQATIGNKRYKAILMK